MSVANNPFVEAPVNPTQPPVMDSTPLGVNPLVPPVEPIQVQPQQPEQPASQPVETTPVQPFATNTVAFTPESFAAQETQPVDMQPQQTVTQAPTTPVMSIQEQVAAMAAANQSVQPVHAAPAPKKEKVVETANQPLSVIIAPPPKLEDGQQIICQLSPGMFDSFIKVLSLLDDRNIINIDDSSIVQLVNNNTAILITNIKQLCGGNNINLHILQPKTNIKLFKAIKDNNDVYIIDDTVNKRFQVISGDVRVWLPKQIEAIAKEVVAPSFTSDQFIGNMVTISKEERSKITTLMSDQSSITLLFKEDQLKGYLVPEKVEASFKQFSGEKISESNADLKLISSSFLNIPSDGDTQITVALQNGVYWMMSKINTAMVEIFIIENLQVMQNDKLLL